MIAPDMQHAITRMSHDAEQLAAKLSDLTGVGADDHELVRAKCAPGGRLVDITFTAEARRLQTHELREAVLSAVGRAADAAQASLTNALAEVTGDTDLLGRDVARQATEQVDQYRKLIDEQRQKLEQLRHSLGHRG